MQKLLPLLFLFLPTQLPAWGANGHRIVAHIAQKNMNPAARARMDEILGNNYLAQVANWPDYIKAESGWDFAKPWHYMTVRPNETPADVAEYNGKREGIDDVREGIDLMVGVLSHVGRGGGPERKSGARGRLQELLTKNKVEPLNGSLDATALAFLIHFIGDVHQPMHVGKNRDLGGNKIAVMYYGDRYNLHSVWDTQLIEHERLSYTEFANFAMIHTRDQKTVWQDDPLRQWIDESVELREEIYNTLYDRTDRESGLPDFSWDYQHDFLPIVENRLAAAGYRAAWLLNKLLG